MKALIVGLAVVISFVVSACADSGGRKPSVGKPEGYVRVTKVIDGDSVVATRLGETRLIGVDTPEKEKCREDEATRFTRDRLLDQRVGYEFDKDRKDKYGRTLAYLYRDGMHNLALVEEGYARAMTVYPNVKYSSLFIDAENAQEGRPEPVEECERRDAVAAAERAERRRERDKAKALARKRAAKALARKRAAKARQRAARRREARDADGDGSVEDAPSSDSGSGGGGSGGGSGGGGEDNVNIPLLPGD